jgi:hypothetical protein
VVVLATAAVVLSPRLQAALGFSGEPLQAYRVGDQIDVPVAAYGNAPETLLLFVRASCAACQNAMPVLSRLVVALQSTRTDVRVLTPSVDRNRQIQYAGSLGLDESHILQGELRRMRVRVVPTAVLVDQEGRILHVAEGGEGLEPFAAAVLARAGER